jgi:hypothetical protein
MRVFIRLHNSNEFLRLLQRVYIKGGCLDGTSNYATSGYCIVHFRCIP